MRKATPYLFGTSLALLFGATASLSMAAPGDQQRSAPAPSSAAERAAPVSSDLPADPAVRWGTLPNGMRYAIMRNQTPSRSASLRLRIGAGSLHEGDDQRGIAHFLEHMVFNGTTNVPEGEFVRRLERHGLRFGADTNASTGFTQTIYKLELPVASDEVVDEALFLFREVADEATLDSDAIDRERNIILSEERARATPRFRIFVDVLANLFPGQRLNDRMPIGLVDTIRTAPRERFVEFYDAYYRPERATLIAVGDFDIDAMEAKIRARFSDWQGAGEAGGDPDVGVVARRQAQARLFVEPGGPDSLSLSWTRPYDDSPDTREARIERVAETVAIQVLNRRLARIASAEGTPPFIGASMSRSSPGNSGEALQLSATLRPGEWQDALTTIEQEWRRLNEHPVTQAELDLVLSGMRTSWDSAVAGAATRRSFQLSDRLVESVDQDRVFTAPATGREIFQQASQGLNPAAVLAAARRLREGSSGPLIYMAAPTPIEGGEQALLATYRASLASAVTAPEARQAAVWPYTDFGTPGMVAERREVGDGIDATLVRFANGVRLTVKSTDYTENEVQVIVNAGAGRANFPEGTPSPAWALGRGAFVSAGLGKIRFDDIREALADRNIGARTMLLDDGLQLAGTARPEDFEVQLQMIAAYVSDPGWDPSGWDRVRSTAAARHNEYRATPSGVYEREAAQLLHAGDRRWGTPTQAEMEASSIDDLRKLIGEPLANGPIEVIVIGNVTVDEAIEKVGATFGALPQRTAGADRPEDPRFPAPTAEPVRLTHNGRADQGLAMIAWPTMGQYAELESGRALAVLSAVYRLRLTDKVREEQGATYSPAVGQSTSAIFDTFGFMFGRIEAPPELLDRFLVDAAAIAADLAENPISADELERARRPILEGLRRSRESNLYWRFNLGGLHENPRVAKAVRMQEEHFERVTPESLRDVARRFLRPDTAWKIQIVPEDTATASAAAM